MDEELAAQSGKVDNFSIDLILRATGSISRCHLIHQNSMTLIMAFH